MAQYLPLPDGSFVTVREGESPGDAWFRAQREYPEAFGISRQQEAAPDQPQPEGGFLPALKAGAQNLAGQAALTAGKAGLIDPRTAEQFAQERSQRAQQIFKPTEESFLEAPLQNTTELLGGSLPYAAAPLVLAGGAKALGLGALAGAGAAGLASLAQFTGSNLERQMGTGKSLEETSGTAAVGAAIPQAALDVIGFRFIPGIGKLFGDAGMQVTSQTAKQLAEQTAKKVAADYAQATGKAMTAGALTETMQQVLERAQADLSTVDPEARAEYLQSFFGGAVLGGALAVPGRFAERTGAASRSRQMASAEEEEAARAAAAQQAQEAQAAEARMAQEANPREMGPTRQIGDQMQIEGVDATFTPAEETPVEELVQERDQLRTMLRNTDALYAAEKRRLAAGRIDGPSAVQQVQQAQKRLAALEKELAAQGIKDTAGTAPSVAQKLRQAEQELQAMAQGDDSSYDPEKADQLQRRIARLRNEARTAGGQETITPDLFGTIDVSQDTVVRNNDLDAQQLADQMAGQRETLSQRRAQIEQEIASLRRMAEGNPNDPTTAANLRRALQAGRALDAEVQQMEQAAAGTNEMAQQPRLFPEPEEQTRVGRGTAGTARSEAELLRDIEIARATTSGAVRRQVIEPLLEQLRALREENRARERDAKTAQTDASALRNRDLEQAQGMQLPADAARRQASTDARYRAYGQYVSLLERFNRGAAAQQDLLNAERQLTTNLIQEAEQIKGAPLEAAERQDALREIRDLLAELKNRFGDTRNEVDTGTRKEPNREPVQRSTGQFRKDLPGTGAGPTGMGLENLESRRAGDRTLGARYAAAQATQERLDDIRNRLAGTQQGAPGVDRTDRNRTDEERLAVAQQQARSTPAQELVQRVADARVKSPEMIENAVQAAMRAQRGQDIEEQQRALDESFRAAEEGMRSETEGDRRQVQTEMFGDRGTLFDSFDEFEQYLASDALAALRLANGQTTETLARAMKMVAPLQKRVAELETQLQKLVQQKNALVGLRDEEQSVVNKRTADAQRAVDEAQAAMDEAVADYRLRLIEAQEKLMAAQAKDAEIAEQIAQNLAVLDASRQFAREGQTAMIGAARKLADAKNALAKHTASLFSSADPISRPKLAKLVTLEKDIEAAQKELLVASDRARASTVAAADPNRLATFQKQAEVLSAQRKQQIRVVASLTAARNRAQRALDAAQTVARADPALNARLANAQDMVALAASMNKGADAGIKAVNAEINALEQQFSAVGEPLQRLRRQAEEQVRAARGTPPARAEGTGETQLDRERRDGQERTAEQQRLEMLQQGRGTEREQVSFEPRRLDQEKLDEASERMRALEEILAKVPMNAEQRTVFEEAAAEYAARTTALEKKAQARLENVEGKLNAQRKRVAALQDAQAAYDAAEPGSPARDRAQARVARLRDEIKTQGEKISKAWGIRREQVVSRAQAIEQRKPRAGDEAEVERIAETQTQRRTTSPATQETRQGGGFRTGNTETVEQRKGAQRTRIVESQRPNERDLPMSAKEMQDANKAAAELLKKIEGVKEAAKAGRAAAEKVATKVENARKKAEVLVKPKAAKPKAPASKTQAAIDDIDPFDDDNFEPALLREDNTYYESNRSTPLSEAMAEAAFDGSVTRMLQDMKENSPYPFHRALADALLPMVGDTKINVLPQVIFGGRRALGAYTPKDNTVVLDAMGGMNEETALHELVHAATLRALRGDVKLRPEQQQALAELQALYEQAKNDPAFRTEYARKNLEEFVSELMSNPFVRDKVALMKAGRTSLLQRIYDKLLSLLGITRAVDTLPAQQAVMNVARLFEPSRSFSKDNLGVASVMRGVFPGTKPEYGDNVPAAVRAITDKTVGRNPTMKDKLLANLTGFRVQFVDRFDPVEKLLRQGVDKKLISDVQAFQTSYFMRFGEQRSQFAEQAATNGVPRLRKTGEGEFVIETPEGKHANIARIAEVLSKANAGNEQATERLFTTYLGVLRGEQVGFDKLNFDEPMTPAQAKQVKDFVNADPARKAAFEEARQIYRQYNNDLLDFMVEMGAMPAAQATALKRGDYVPYYRQDPNGMVNLIIAGEQPVRIGNIKDQPYLQELVGGNDKILPFFTGALQNTNMLIGMALRNKQVMEIADMMRQLGVAKVVKGMPPSNADAVPYKIKGEQAYMLVDKSVENWGVPADVLIKGLEGIKTTIPAALRALQIPANLLRVMITRAPAYAVRQIIREPLNAWMTTGGNFTPIVSSVKELAKILQKGSPAADALERGGAISSNVITGDMQDQARVLRDISQGKSLYHKALSAADKFAMQGDTATRAVLYDTFRKQGMTHMQATLAALESMNFGRRGLSPTMQMMSMLVPFFNAQVQGMDVIYRAAKGQTTFEQKQQVQRKLLARGAMMAAGTLAYVAMMQDDESYKNATAQQRALNWFLPIPGSDESLRIPIPFELGYAFKALPELVFNTAFGDTKAGDAASAFGSLLYQAVPIGMPQAIKPALEVMTNYSFFTGENIEGQRDRAVNVEQRMRDNTTELSKMLGGAGVLSPIQIDYLIRGYTGGLGLTLVGLSNFALRPISPVQETAEGPTKTLSQMPLLGPLFQPADGRAVIDEAYKDIESWQQASQTYKRMIEQGRRADAQRYAQEFSGQISLATTGGAFRQQMGELAAARRAVVASPDLTPDQKRQQVDQIRQLEIQLSRRVRELSARVGG